jgi:hypothetical protein
LVFIRLSQYVCGSIFLFTGLFGVATLASDRVSQELRTLRKPVRIPRPKIGKLAFQAENVGIFAFSEYPGSSRHSRCGSVTFEGKQLTVVF